MSFSRPRFMQSWVDAYQRGGVRGLLSEKGWKVLVVFFFIISSGILYCTYSFHMLVIHILARAFDHE